MSPAQVMRRSEGRKHLRLLGGVLCHVRDHDLSARPLVSDADGLDIDLSAPARFGYGAIWIGRRLRHHFGDCRPHGLGQQLGGELGGWSEHEVGSCLGWTGVEADDDMEVDQPPALDLADFHEGQPYLLFQLAYRPAGKGRQFAQDTGWRALPQLGGERVPLHRAFIVETVAAQRLAQQLVVFGVLARADQFHAVSADFGLRASSRVARLNLSLTLTSGVHRPETRGSQGDEQHRVGGDGVGDALAPGEPAVTSWKASPR